MDLNIIEENMEKAIEDLLEVAEVNKGDAIVLGGSTSEIIGKDLGSSTNMEVARDIVDIFISSVKIKGYYPVIQGCEHINRSLVVDREYSLLYNLTPVNVIPIPEAGGGFATAAMELLDDPVVVEKPIRVAAGIDIGDVFIGMHLDPNRVGVVVRSDIKAIGQAHLSMIRTRPKLIGGLRAKHF